MRSQIADTQDDSMEESLLSFIMYERWNLRCFKVVNEHVMNLGDFVSTIIL